MSTNSGAIAAIAATLVLSILAIVLEIRAQRRRRTKTPSADSKVDPVPNEADAPEVINTQPTPSSEDMKESDEVTLSLSPTTRTDLPATPMRVYDPNNASRLPEPQVDLYTRRVSSREMFGEYEGSEITHTPANMQVSSLSLPQGHSSLPTFPESRYSQYSRSVPQDSFRQSQGTGNTLRQTNMQVSPPPSQGHSDLPILPESQRELYHPSVSPLVIDNLPTSPEPQDEAYSPSVSPRAIFGRCHGTGNTLAQKTRLAATSI